ncbi:MULTISPECIES: ATP-binding protein [Kitasatospora]|uniref:ATP-binding protein n=1 Tax=Kitasatospora TaxID=2063 RepID=UPI0015D651F0|nr:ATP-binding protein [Kitasatospora sp. GP30]
MSSNSFLLIRAASAVPASRAHVARLLRRWGVRTDEDSSLALEIVVSELVTNAVTHGAGLLITVALAVNVGAGSLIVEVHDRSARMPRCRQAAEDDEGGRGLALVAALVIAHGCERTLRGKKVWAEIALPPQVLTRRQFIFRSRRATWPPLQMVSGAMRRLAEQRDDEVR